MEANLTDRAKTRTKTDSHDQEQILCFVGAGGRDRTDDLLITSPISGSYQSNQCVGFSDLTASLAHRNAPNGSGTGKDAGKDILMAIGTMEPYSRSTLKRVFQAAAGGHDPEEFEWLVETWFSDMVIVRKTDLPIVEVTKSEAKRLEYARRGAEKLRHETLKVSAAAFLQARGLGAYQYEASVRYGRADVYFPNFDVAVEVGLCPCSRAVESVANGQSLCVVPYRKSPTMFILIGDDPVAKQFIVEKSQQRMDRIADRMRRGFATDPIANGRDETLAGERIPGTFTTQPGGGAR